MSNKTIVGIVQSRPVFLNLKASLKKGRRALVKQAAAARNAQIAAFGETWLAGYPVRRDFCPNIALWDYEPTQEVFAGMRRNSVVVPSRETEMLSRAARKNKIAVDLTTKLSRVKNLVLTRNINLTFGITLTLKIAYDNSSFN